MAGDEYSYTGVIRTFQRLFVNGEDSAIQTIIKNSNKNVNASADTSTNVNTDVNEKAVTADLVLRYAADVLLKKLWKWDGGIEW